MFNLFDKIEWRFFQDVAVLILLYDCITRTMTKPLEKKLDGNYTRMLRAVLYNTGSNISKNSECMATYRPSHKHSIYDEQNMLSTDA